jgi:hypothetical protein
LASRSPAGHGADAAKGKAMSVRQCCFIHGDFTGDDCPECTKRASKPATSAEAKLARVAAAHKAWRDKLSLPIETLNSIGLILEDK